MKVYLVYEYAGEYEDYSKDLLKAFFNKENAENFKAKKEKELENDKIQYKQYCSKCNGIAPINGCNKYQSGEDNDCVNMLWSWDIENISYTIEEIEVE